MTTQEQAERLADVMAQTGVRHITALTDTHTIKVSEPSMWEPQPPIVAPLYGLLVEITEHDI